MSTHGTDFLHKWIAINLPDQAHQGVISVAELVQRIFADAKAIGIGSEEIEEDAGSVYQVVLEAIIHQPGGYTEFDASSP